MTATVEPTPVAATAGPTDPGQLDGATRFWWVRVPLEARRLSVGWFMTMSDGWQLVAIPPLSAWLSLASLGLGLFFGATHFTFADVFTESALFILIAVALGLSGAQLGVLLTIGFGIGDFFIAHPDWASGGELTFGEVGLIGHIWGVRIPLIIQYGLLALVTTTVPAAIKSLLGQLRFAARLPPTMAFWLMVGLHALLAFVLVYFWTQAVAVLIVPVYSWGSGFSAADPSTINLQTSGLGFSLIAALAAVGRFILQARAVTEDGPATQRVAAIATQMNAAQPVQPLADRVPILVRIAARTLWAVLLLAGLMTDVIDAVILGGIVAVLQLIRAGFISVPLGRWPQRAQRIPLLLRLAAGFALIWFISLQLEGFLIDTAQDFRPLALLTGLSMVVFLLLVPPVPSRGPEPAAEGAPP